MTVEQSLSPAAFLDRDGVINRDLGYVHSMEQFEFLPGAIEGMKALSGAGYQLVVITNQSGIGRGYYTEAQFAALSAEMTTVLRNNEVRLAGIFHCPHVPADSGGNICSCRKPMPGMILEGARLLELDLTKSILIGDKATDIEAGIAAGVPRCYKVGTNGAPGGDFPDLASVAAYILSAP